MIEYQVTAEPRSAPDLGTYCAYGIRAVETPGVHAPFCSIADVFCRRAAAEDFCARLNRLRLDPIHLMDVVEDALSDGL